METAYSMPVQSPALLAFAKEEYARFAEPHSFPILDEKENMAHPTVVNTEITTPLADRDTNILSPKPAHPELAAPQMMKKFSGLESSQVDENFLHASPYSDTGNLLDLRGLSTPSRFLALALTFLEPTRPDYATAPYLESFNWQIVFHMLRHLCRAADFKWQRKEFYVVIFRSILKEDVDRHRLGELDQRSHMEACASGGLLKYWFGKTDEQNRNLATCTFKII